MRYCKAIMIGGDVYRISVDPCYYLRSNIPQKGYLEGPFQNLLFAIFIFVVSGLLDYIVV